MDVIALRDCLYESPYEAYSGRLLYDTRNQRNKERREKEDAHDTRMWPGKMTMTEKARRQAQRVDMSGAVYKHGMVYIPIPEGMGIDVAEALMEPPDLSTKQLPPRGHHREVSSRFNPHPLLGDYVAKDVSLWARPYDKRRGWRPPEPWQRAAWTKHLMSENDNKWKLYDVTRHCLALPPWFAYARYGAPGVNHSTEGDPCRSMEFKLEPRPHQLEAIERIKEYMATHATDGVGVCSVVMGCGFGKTATGVLTQCTFGRKAMWSIHDSSIAGDIEAEYKVAAPDLVVYQVQGKNSICSKVASKRIAEADVLIVSTSSLVSWIGTYGFNWVRRKLQVERWGVYMVDEAHRYKARQWMQVLRVPNAKYRVHFTATPTDELAMTPVLEYWQGPMVYCTDPARKNKFVKHSGMADSVLTGKKRKGDMVAQTDNANIVVVYYQGCRDVEAPTDSDGSVVRVQLENNLSSHEMRNCDQAALGAVAVAKEGRTVIMALPRACRQMPILARAITDVMGSDVSHHTYMEGGEEKEGPLVTVQLNLSSGKKEDKLMRDWAKSVLREWEAEAPQDRLVIDIGKSCTSDKARARKERLERRKRHTRILISTQSKIKEGFNMKLADTLMLLGFNTGLNINRQTLGRILRQMAGKAMPLCIDWVDSVDECTSLANGLRKRIKDVYKPDNMPLVRVDFGPGDYAPDVFDVAMARLRARIAIMADESSSSDSASDDERGTKIDQVKTMDTLGRFTKEDEDSSSSEDDA